MSFVLYHGDDEILGCHSEDEEELLKDLFPPSDHLQPNRGRDVDFYDRVVVEEGRFVSIGSKTKVRVI